MPLALKLNVGKEEGRGEARRRRRTGKGVEEDRGRSIRRRK